MGALASVREVQGRGLRGSCQELCPEASSQCRVSSGGDLGMGLGLPSQPLLKRGSLWGQRVVLSRKRFLLDLLCACQVLSGRIHTGLHLEPAVGLLQHALCWRCWHPQR